MSCNDIFKKCGVVYEPHLVIEPSMDPYLKRTYALSEKRGFFCDERRWLSKLHRDEILSGYVAPVEVKYIDKQVGYGLFAAQDFEPWQFIGIYSGKVTRRGLLRFNSNDYCFRYPTAAWWNPKPLMVDALKMGNETRFINHSDEPNTQSVGLPVDGLIYVLFRTNQAIPKGGQITYDYGAAYWRGIGRNKLNIST